jgi:hypothetical protein
MKHALKIRFSNEKRTGFCSELVCSPPAVFAATGPSSIQSPLPFRLIATKMVKINMKPQTLFLSAGILLGAFTNGFGQPVITQQPASRTASLFADAGFRVTANGDAPLSYQWRFNDGDLIGMTKTTLILERESNHNCRRSFRRTSSIGCWRTPNHD